MFNRDPIVPSQSGMIRLYQKILTHARCAYVYRLFILKQTERLALPLIFTAYIDSTSEGIKGLQYLVNQSTVFC